MAVSSRRFVLGCVGAFFQFIAFVFSFGQGGKKFVGFYGLVAGLCFIATAILFFLAKKPCRWLSRYHGQPERFTLTLGWGFIAAALPLRLRRSLSLALASSPIAPKKPNFSSISKPGLPRGGLF
jgi:hypothetical protein